MLPSDLKQKKNSLFNFNEIVFLGRSNVGKSSLINILIKRKHLVKKSSVSGSTIKINYFNFQKRLMLVDFPGYGYAKNNANASESLNYFIEGHLLNTKYLKKIIFIIDSRRGIAKIDIMLLLFFQDLNISILLIFNKIDKLKKLEIKNLNNFIYKIVSNFNFIKGIIFASCHKKWGIKKIKKNL